MKKLKNIILHRRQLIFLDFEGTQQSHELIAFGAVKVDLHDDLTIKKSYKGLHRLVRPKKEIGRYVSKLTNITEVDVFDKGIPFFKALLSLRNYAGKKFKDTVFVIFGNHDLRILNQSLVHSPDGDAEIVKTITKNALDFSQFLSEFIKDSHGNPLSLVNNLNLFNVSFNGKAHHPLDDAKNLLMLYQKVLAHPEIMLKQYQQVLSSLKHLPVPLKNIVKKILNQETVDYAVLEKEMKDYLG